MKTLAALSFMIVVSSGYAASAAPLHAPDYSDVDVVSVTPRNPDVKPLVMAIFTKEQQQRVGIFIPPHIRRGQQHDARSRNHKK